MIKNSQNTGRSSINGMCKVIKVGEVEEDPSRISRLSKWMQCDDIFNLRIQKEEQNGVEKTNSVSSSDETEVPCVGHLNGARIAENWKLRSRVQKRSC